MINISNIFDLKLIINLSVSITIGVFFAMTLSKVAADLLFEYFFKILKWFGIKVIKKLFPIKFKIFVINEKSNILDKTFSKIININFGKLSQDELPATNLEFCIKPEIKNLQNYMSNQK